jgi:hypothetical protein
MLRISVYRPEPVTRRDLRSPIGSAGDGSSDVRPPTVEQVRACLSVASNRLWPVIRSRHSVRSCEGGRGEVSEW